MRNHRVICAACRTELSNETTEPTVLSEYDSYVSYAVCKDCRATSEGRLVAAIFGLPVHSEGE